MHSSAKPACQRTDSCLYIWFNSSLIQHKVPLQSLFYLCICCFGCATIFCLPWMYCKRCKEYKMLSEGYLFWDKQVWGMYYIMSVTRRIQRDKLYIISKGSALRFRMCYICIKCKSYLRPLKLFGKCFNLTLNVFYIVTAFCFWMA